MEGDRGNATAGQAGSPISIHALRVEGDGIYQAYTRKATRFLSTPSGWRATVPRGDCAAHVPDFYPRPPGGGRLDKPYSRFDGTLFLSTPSGWRATSRSTTLCTMCLNFYPRPPGGGRLSPFANAIAFIPFLSTPSGWRATLFLRTPLRNPKFLSTPSGWRATIVCFRASFRRRFLSTPSGWRATAKTDKVFICFCAKGRRICLFKTRKEKNLLVAF